MTPERMVTPDGLTTALRAHGYLTMGAVATVGTDTFETPPSVLTRLAVDYTADAPADAPRRLFLKVPKPHKTQRFLREVRFYGRVAPLLRGVSLARCLASSEGTDADPPWLLLDDAFASHRPFGEGAPGVSDLLDITSALAGLHAAMWGRADLEEVAGVSAMAAFWDDFTGNEHRLVELEDILGDRFPERWRQIYRRALYAAPDLLLARSHHGALTLCHPDAHAGNFLLPRRRGDPTLIIDWHDYRAWWGAADVSRLLMGDTTLRRSCERRVLGHYCMALREAGVTGYGWDDLWRDYRLSVLQSLFVPLGNRRQPWAWDQVECAVLAFEDLECGELLTRAESA